MRPDFAACCEFFGLKVASDGYLDIPRDAVLTMVKAGKRWLVEILREGVPAMDKKGYGFEGGLL